MKYRVLGKTQLKVSEIAFGGAAISGEGGGYGFGDITEVESEKLLKAALERGINFFDTAPIYGFGLSEQRLGKAFKKMRDKVILVSKCGVTWHENKRVDMNNSAKVTQKMLEQSLRDLQTDYIDLYMVHWPDARVDIRETVEVLAKAQMQNKIRYIGLCNTFEEDYHKASEVAEISVFQSEFSLTQSAVESNLFPLCEKNNIGFMSWGTLDKGILTGRVIEERKFDASDCRSWAPWWNKKEVLVKVEKVKKLKAFLQDKDYDLLTSALAYNLSFKNVSSAICGVRNLGQLESLLEAHSQVEKVAVAKVKEFFL
ncbi:MAG: aldo/keto reductase [Bacteriovoracaceae bacterium]|nr:aldo/keto reductase [Bacteriovoracaceae bacterium]